jgi:glycine dehydrogenase
MRIAQRIGAATRLLRTRLEAAGLTLAPSECFDTLSLKADPSKLTGILERAEKARINLYVHPQGLEYQLSLSLDERTSTQELEALEEILTGKSSSVSAAEIDKTAASYKLSSLNSRDGAILHHTVFNSYHSETELMRYIDRLERKDYSLTDSMIPLGSCTMKLNAASELLPVAWDKIADMHPFVPAEQARGYKILSNQLESWLAEITGMAGTSLQPNAGSQGEYAGLLAIRGYLRAKGEAGRDTLIIPTSAHGTNPASAVMAGFKVATVGCRENGDIDVDALRAKTAELGSAVAGIMITYPSTHGVFEETLSEIVGIIHGAGGQVYMDGANFNALTGLVRPGDVGVDVMHLNLHKTFCIPHGGGGPGIGPICVQKHLLPHLAHNRYAAGGQVGDTATMVASADLGSAGILVIPWMYIRMMGAEGLTAATTAAILSANYISKRLKDSFETLYSQKGYVAHECILDCRAFKRRCGVDVTDIAKRLMDFGFHAPTVSWPVAETLMVEPTESESKAELDRFCEAMIQIRAEIAEVDSGQRKPEESPLRNSPHTVETLTSDEWNYNYSREEAAYPLAWLRERKLWPSVGRIDNAWGDRNLFCACGE